MPHAIFRNIYFRKGDYLALDSNGFIHGMNRGVGYSYIYNYINYLRHRILFKIKVNVILMSRICIFKKHVSLKRPNIMNSFFFC